MIIEAATITETPLGISIRYMETAADEEAICVAMSILIPELALWFFRWIKPLGIQAKALFLL